MCLKLITYAIGAALSKYLTPWGSGFSEFSATQELWNKFSAVY